MKEKLDRIEILKIEILERQNEIESLISELISLETDIHKKFQTWANNGLKKKTLRHLPDGAIREWCDKHLDFGHMRGSVCLLDYDEEFLLFSLSYDEMKEMGWVNTQEDIESVNRDIEILKKDELFVRACEQMIRENIEGFDIDW